jgi:hypothetical protein
MYYNAGMNQPKPPMIVPRRARRAKARPPAPESRELKDRVLQARVPETLYADLVEQARRLRVPVSNLVRNILEDSLRMVENIVDGGLEIAAALAPKPSAKELSAVLGWQPLTANKAMACQRCGGAIAKGDGAFLSVGAPGGRAIVICGECKCAI